MQHILVPIDFSEVSHQAMLFAAEIAGDLGASVTLLHVHSKDSSKVKRPYLAERSQRIIDEDYERLMEELSLLLIESQHNNFEVSWTIVDKTKRISEHIVDFMESHDLLIMGTNGANQIEDHIVGSTTTAVMDRVDLPVIALPGSFTFDGVLDHVLFVADFNDFPMDSLATVRYCFSKLNPKITVLDINLGHNPVIDRLSSELQKEMEEVVFQSVDATDEIQAIVDYAGTNQVDLVALPTKRRNWWQRLFERSYTENMVLSTKLAIMSV